MITATRPEVEPETLSGVELLEEMLAIPSPSTQERGLGTPAATKAVVVLILSPQVSATS